MAATKRFITYKCSVCKRTKDYVADDLRVFINLCTITQNCSGKLSPIATKNIRSILPSTPVDGVLDWIPKNTITQTANEILPTVFPIDSNDLQVLTIAVKNLGTPLPQTFDLTFTAQKTNVQEFVEYTYSLAANQNTIIGADNSSQAKVLKFLETDNLVVYVNGVQTDQYVLQFSGTVGYAIVLNSTRTSISDIKIIVYPLVDITDTSTIQFGKNELLTFSKPTAWSALSTVTIEGYEYVLYSALVNSLPVNKELNLYPGNALVDLNLSNMYFLLSNNPYTNIDRILNFVVPLNILTTPELWCKYYVDSASKLIYAAYSALTELINPIKFISSEIVTVEITNNEEIIPLPKSKYIIGAI